MADNKANIIISLVDQFTGKMNGINKSMDDSKAKMAAMSHSFAIAGVAVTAAITGMIVQAVNFGDKIYEASQKTGVSTEALSGLKYAVEQNEGSFEALTMGLTITNQKLVDAANGSKMAKSEFEKVGISIADASGKLKSADQVLLELAGNFEKGKISSQELEAAARNLAGRGGSELIGFLKQGKTGIEEYMKLNAAMGNQINNETAKAMDDFNDNLASLKASFLSISMAVAQTVVPMLNGIIDWAMNGVTWLKQIMNVSEALGKVFVRIAGLVAKAAELMLHPFSFKERLRIADDMKKDLARIPEIWKEMTDKAAGISDNFRLQQQIRENIAAKEKVKIAGKTSTDIVDIQEKGAKEAAEKTKQEWEGTFLDLEKEADRFIDTFVDLWTRGGADLADVFNDIGKSFQVEFIKAGFEPLKFQLGLFMGEMKENIKDMVKGISGLFGGDTLIGGLVGGGIAGGIGSLIGGMVTSLIDSFKPIPHYGQLALQAMQDAANKVAKLWANAVDTLDRSLKTQDVGGSLWDKLFEKVDKSKKMDLSVLGIPGLAGFADYATGLKEILKTHIASLSGMSEAEAKEVNEKKKAVDALAAYSAAYEAAMAQIQGGGISDIGAYNAAQQAMTDAANAYHDATGETIPALHDLAAKLAEAQTTYSEAVNQYAAGNISQEELINIIDEMKTAQEKLGLTDEQMAVMMKDQIDQMVIAGTLNELQAQALRESLGIQEKVRDALIAGKLETLANSSELSNNREALEEQLKALGLSIDSNGNVVDSNGTVYAAVTALGKDTYSLMTVSQQLMSKEERLNVTNGKLISSVDNLRGAIERLQFPAFASGINYVPYDMIAKIHKGERVVPANQNYNTNSTTLNISLSGGTSSTAFSGQMDEKQWTRIYRDVIKPAMAKEAARII